MCFPAGNTSQMLPFVSVYTHLENTVTSSGGICSSDFRREFSGYHVVTDLTLGAAKRFCLGINQMKPCLGALNTPICGVWLHVPGRLSSITMGMTERLILSTAASHLRCPMKSSRTTAQLTTTPRNDVNTPRRHVQFLSTNPITLNVISSY